VLNLGIEGIFTAGAMAGWMAVFLGAGLWTGVLVAALTGAAFGLIHALLTVPLGLSQHVTGIGVTMLATSASYYIYRIALPNVATPPRITAFQPVNIPGLSNLLK
jgi:simple sugar transport system permease protein